jgi:hypothetical protein
MPFLLSPPHAFLRAILEQSLRQPITPGLILGLALPFVQTSVKASRSSLTDLPTEP